jgi:hypothetical protein
MNITSARYCKLAPSARSFSVCRIGVGAPRGEGVAGYLTDGHAQTARRLVPAARLYPAKHSQDFRGADFGNRASANGGFGQFQRSINLGERH